MADRAQLALTGHSGFVSGDDAEAKQAVTELLESFGWTDIIDLGDITSARDAEMVLPHLVAAVRCAPEAHLQLQDRSLILGQRSKSDEAVVRMSVNGPTSRITRV